ncbi:hypothetical protein BDN67DRAFT_587520 [Paxillus ammoniavirescens]|nr:hypothetical protein BDN67DRAFT_587520 [Paxillus ammoniavirescens]
MPTLVNNARDSLSRIQSSNILHSAMPASHPQAELLRLPVPESEKRMVRYLQSSSQFSSQTNTPESHLLPHPMFPNELSPVASLPVPVHLQRLTSSPHHWLGDGFGTKKDVLVWRAPLLINSNLWSTSVNDWGVPVVTDEGPPPLGSKESCVFGPWCRFQA